MAVIRELSHSDNLQTQLTTVALFCGISCTVLIMLKFRGFKASLNLSSGKWSSGKGHCDLAPQVSVSGAYRTSRDEYYGNNNYLESRKKITPSMVKLPPQTHRNDVPVNMRPSKSTGDISDINIAPVELRKSTPNVAVPNTVQSSKEAKQQLKEQKRIEKERLAQEKKREKLAAQEREKQEKLRKEREKQLAQQRAKEAKENQKKKKKVAPLPEQKATKKQSNIPSPPPFKMVGPTAQPNANPLSQKLAQHPTNTLGSSISQSSGPPPYANKSEVVPIKGNTSNTTNNNVRYVQPVEASSSWDMITKHRQQINRTPGITDNKPRQKHLDLIYNVGNSSNSDDKDNSEA